MNDSPSDEAPVETEAPQRELIGSRAELAAAVMQLIARARRQLRFAATDLSVLALGDLQSVSALRTMLRAQPRNLVRLLVDDMSWLDTRAPRLRALQRSFPHALLIRRSDPHDRVGRDVVAIGDDADALRLLPTASIRGEFWRRSGEFAQPLAIEFDRRWEHASHNQAVQPLGL